MTILEFQPYVEQALTAVEWELARIRWRQGLDTEREAITKALPLAGSYGVEREPLEARLADLDRAASGDVSPDLVPTLPLRSVPMDLITAAVIRRILRIPADFPILGIKTVPGADAIIEAVLAIANRWPTANCEMGPEPEQIASHV